MHPELCIHTYITSRTTSSKLFIKHGRPHTKPFLFFSVGVRLKHAHASAVRSYIIAQTRSVLLRVARPHPIGIIVAHLPTQQGLISHFRRIRLASTHTSRELPRPEQRAQEGQLEVGRTACKGRLLL